MTTCPCCNRPFRTAASAERATRYQAVLAELRGGPPASHLGPLTEPLIPKLERHRQQSTAYRQRGNA